ncbi:MAG: putative glycolipid-binding domain-containing protein [Nakamurella sp.]
MTEPSTTKMISYSSPDGRKMESVRVALSGLALRATGYIVSTQDPAYGAVYSIAVDGEGRTRRITVRSDDVSGERSLSLTRSPGGPWVAESVTGSVPVPALNDAIDVYVADSAFSAMLPIRRLGLHTTVGASVEVTVASISLPDLTVTPMVQVGRNESVTDEGALISYTGSYGERKVLVDHDGLFIRTDGITERVG